MPTSQETAAAAPGNDRRMWWLGLAPLEGLRVPAVLLALALFFFGLWKLYVAKREVWIFFAAIVLAAPALVFVLWNPQYIYFRYFSVCFPFFYLLLAYVLAEWFAQRGVIKLAAVLMAAAITTGQMVKNEGLLRLGRGEYLQALLDMAAATPGPVVRVSSDHDFRNGSLVVFCSRYLPPSKQVDYITRPRRDQETPDWMILHCWDPTFQAYPDEEIGGIGTYDLFRVYPFGGGSGWSWFVYRRPEGLVPAHAQAPQPAIATNSVVQ